MSIAPEANNELARLEERARKLAMEKAHLNLLIHMMGRLGAVTGLDNAVANLLQVILSNIGGVNLVLYYWIDDEIYYADVFGKNAKLAAIEDAYVAQAAKSRVFFEHEHDFRDTHMITPAFTKARTWVIPLLVGPDLIGVLKIEGLHIDTDALKQQLPTFFSYVALLLKNEILGYTRLQRAYNQLREAHAELTLEAAERQRAEEALLNSERKLRAVVYGSPIPQFVIDRDHRVVYWNRALEELSGIQAAEIVGTDRHWRAFYAAERPCMADLLLDGTEAERGPELYPGKHDKSRLVAGAYEGRDFFPSLGKNGRWLSFTAIAIRDIHGQVVGAVETLQDITGQKRLEEKLRALSIVDELTGLYNRRGFLTLARQQMKSARRAQKRLLFFYADLDNMKPINDTLGHHEGDLALLETAAALRKTFRESDILGRMGGDEFAVLAMDVSPETMEILIERLRAHLSAARPFGAHTLSVSIGTACLDPSSPVSLDELMARADALMYEEKRGKNCKPANGRP